MEQSKNIDQVNNSNQNEQISDEFLQMEVKTQENITQTQLKLRKDSLYEETHKNCTGQTRIRPKTTGGYMTTQSSKMLRKEFSPINEQRSSKKKLPQKYKEIKKITNIRRKFSEELTEAIQKKNQKSSNILNNTQDTQKQNENKAVQKEPFRLYTNTRRKYSDEDQLSVKSSEVKFLKLNNEKKLKNLEFQFPFSNLTQEEQVMRTLQDKLGYKWINSIDMNFKHEYCPLNQSQNYVYSDVQLIRVFNFLQQLSDLRTLNISVRMNKRCSSYFLNMFQFKHSLIDLRLELKEANLGPDGAKILGASLSKLKNIQFLRLIIKKNNLQSDGIKNITECFKNITKLKQLTFKIFTNKMGEIGAKQMSKNLIFLQDLEKLNLMIGNDNQCSNEGIKHIANVIKALQNLTKLKISIGENNCQDASFLSKCFGKKIEKISINIGRNTLFDENGLSQLGQNLNILENIRIFHLRLLGNNNQGNQIEINRLTEKLEKSQVKSLLFDIRQSTINVDTFEKFSQNLYSLEQLSELSLYFATINGLNSNAISQFLKNGQKMKNLTNLIALFNSPKQEPRQATKQIFKSFLDCQKTIKRRKCQIMMADALQAKMQNFFKNKFVKILTLFQLIQ